MTVFPNVPVAPGVPPVARAVNAVVAPVVLLVEDLIFGPQAVVGPQWGIFDQFGQPVIIGDSCVGVQFRKPHQISDYPIEQGSFSSLNKVEMPYDFKMTFTKGGSIGEKQNFLNSVDAICRSLVLFNAVTPEFTYLNANPVTYDYNRSARDGATLLTVDIFLEEVRQTAQASFTNNTKSPDGAAQYNGGTVQGVSPGSQTTTPVNGTTTGIISTASPTSSITSAVGNQLPTGISPIGSTVTYLDDNGQPQTGIVQSVSTFSGSGNLIGYNLTNGQHAAINNVTSISPGGSSTVQ